MYDICVCVLYLYDVVIIHDIYDNDIYTIVLLRLYIVSMVYILYDNTILVYL